MNPEVNSRLNSWIKAFPRFAGAAAIAVGSSVIVGWIFDVPLLKSLSPDMVSMKANIALDFMLAGTALLLLSASGAGKQRMIARFLASLVFLVGLLTVAEYAFAWDAGIDQLLFNEPHRTIGTYSPGRMALNSAISFCLLGLALLTLKSRNRWGKGAAHILTLIVGLLGLLGLLSYVYGLSEFSGYAVYTRMALHTAGTFLFLSVGVLCLQPDVGIMIVVTSQSAGGFMARRLMLAAVVVPLVLGWLIVGGGTWGWYGRQFGDVIFATAYIAIALVLVWRIARSLNQMEAERKSAAEALRQTEAHYRLMVEHASDLIYNVDSRGYITFVNPATVRMLGYLPNEVVGRRYVEFVRPDFQKRAERSFFTQFLRKTPSVYNEAPVLTKDGRELWLGQNVGLIFENDEVVGFHAVSRDITERKRAEEALRESEEWFSTLADTTSTGIFIYQDVRIVYVNRAAGMLSGYTAEEFLALRFWDLIHPDYRELVRERGLARQRGDPKPDCYEVKIMRKDGEVRWIDFTAGKIDWQGQPAVLGTAFDITERKRAEEALRASEARFSTVFHASPIGLSITCLADGQYVDVNDAFLTLFGYTREEALSHTSVQLQTWASSEERDRVVRMLSEQGRVRSTEAQYRRKSGEVWTALISAELIEVAGERYTLGLLQDITERTRAEQERESLIEELKTALENVRTLGGLVPICSHCKKIRDDKGYWNQLEKYLGDHTDAKLTHGLCPDCTKLYFPSEAAMTSPGGSRCRGGGSEGEKG